MIESLLLVSSVCIDAFVASIAYGTNKIKIPFYASIVISIIGSIFLGISLFLGSFIKDFLPTNFAVLLSFCILMIIGIYRFFEGIFKNYISKKNKLLKPLKFKIFDLNFVLQVYADETIADFDHSKVLTIKESLYLASALSFDSIAVGFGDSLGNSEYLSSIFLCFIIGVLAVSLGQVIGKKLVEKSNLNLSWLSGIILMVLAVKRLF